MEYVIMIALVCFCITMHEFGHFYAGRIAGVSAKTFSVGIGPTLVQNKIGETNFKLCLIPILGYVDFDKDFEDPNSEVSLPKRLWIFLAGVFVNALLAMFAVSALSILEGNYGFTDLVIKPFAMMGYVFVQFFSRIVEIFSDINNFDGAIGIAQLGVKYKVSELKNFLTMFIGINASLMILNILPIPGLDGGRIMTSLLSYWNRYYRIKNYVNVVFSLALIIFIIFINVKDFIDLF